MATTGTTETTPDWAFFPVSDAVGLDVVHRRETDLSRHYRGAHVFESAIVPGPVQTVEYARGVMSARLAYTDDSWPRPEAEIDAAVQQRLARQQMLLEHGHDTRVLLTLAPLRGWMPGPGAAARQIRHLIQIVDSGQMNVGIIPDGAEALEMTMVGFWLYPGEVRVDTGVGTLAFTGGQLDAYRRCFDALAQAAVYGQAAAGLLRTELDQRYPNPPGLESAG